MKRRVNCGYRVVATPQCILSDEDTTCIVMLSFQLGMLSIHLGTAHEQGSAMRSYRTHAPDENDLHHAQDIESVVHRAPATFFILPPA